MSRKKPWCVAVQEARSWQTAPQRLRPQTRCCPSESVVPWVQDLFLSLFQLTSISQCTHDITIISISTSIDFSSFFSGIFMVSSVGVMLPMLAMTAKLDSVFFVLRAIGAGVVLATGFVHVLGGPH